MAPKLKHRKPTQLTPWPKKDPAKIGEFNQQNTFTAFPEAFRLECLHKERVTSLEKLLDAVQALDTLQELEKPDWNPPEIEDKTTDLDVARMLLRDALGNNETEDWDEARVWREMYEHTYEVADKLRQMAQNLDDKCDEGVKDVEEHNKTIVSIREDARNFWLSILHLDL